jgi:hypothetical protein
VKTTRTLPSPKTSKARANPENEFAAWESKSISR